MEIFKSNYLDENNKFKDGAKEKILNLFSDTSKYDFTANEIFVVTKGDIDPDIKSKIYFQAIKKNEDEVLLFMRDNFNDFIDSDIKLSDKKKLYYI